MSHTPRTLPQIIAHVRAVVGDPSISTTLIQTEDLTLLCDAADALTELRRDNLRLRKDGEFETCWIENAALELSSEAKRVLAAIPGKAD